MFKGDYGEDKIKTYINRDNIIKYTYYDYISNKK